MGMFDDIGLDGLEPTATGGLEYYVDIAILIDATAKMAPIINEVKEKAMEFCVKFHEAMEAGGKNVEELRIKVIPFRDYAFDGAQSMDDSGFFSLPDQYDAFRDYVESITAKGGGEEYSSALEAMALAMRSDWTTNGDKRCHVILVFTNASAIPLKESSRKASPYYPCDMPADLAQLGDMWSGCSQEMSGMPEERSARLVLFVPNVQPWCDMQVWNNVWPSFLKAGVDLEEIDIEMAIQIPYRGY